MLNLFKFSLHHRYSFLLRSKENISRKFSKSIFCESSVCAPHLLTGASRINHESVLELDGYSLTIGDLVRAGNDPSIKVKVAARCWEDVEACHRVKEDFAAGESIVYGINTSCGSLVNRMLPKTVLREFQKNLVRSVATQVGDPFELPYVRSAMIARINSLCRGFSGIHPENLRILQEMVNHNVIPVVPQKGSLGASGDLGPLACIAQAAIGEWEVFYQGQRLASAQGMAAAGVPLMELGPKEGLALINGTSMMSAVAAHVVQAAVTTMLSADVVAGLAMEGLVGHKNPFDLRTHQLKYHPGQYATAVNFQKILEGSKLLVDDNKLSGQLAAEMSAREKTTDRDNHEALVAGTPMEDAYSIRCIPQYLGPSRDLIHQARQSVERELNSSNDNPLILPHERTFLHNGNFHGQFISVAMDMVNLAINPVGIISDRRIDRYLDENHSAGLPPLLIDSDIGSRMGLMGGQFMTTSLVAENRTNALPVSIQSIPSTADFQDVVSFGLIAARKAMESVHNVNAILAFEAICAAQAVDLRTHEQPDRLSHMGQATYQLIRQYIPFQSHDSNLMPRLANIAQQLIGGGQLLAAAEKLLGPLMLTHEMSYLPPARGESYQPPSVSVSSSSSSSSSSLSSNHLQFLGGKLAQKFPQSQVAHQTMRQYLPGGNTKSLAYTPPFPVVIQRGAGAIVETVEGEPLIDFMAAYGTLVHGHAHPRINEVVKKAVDDGVLFGAPTLRQHQFAEALCRRVPALEQVRFVNSGSEAVLFAIRLARKHTQRKAVLMFRGGYHGVLDTTAIGGIVRQSGFNVLLADGLASNDTIVGTYNDVVETEFLIDANSHHLAAIILEPFLGANGLIRADPAFLDMLRRQASKYGILLIYDEITSLRSGYAGMAAEWHRALDPDLVTLGKLIGGGFPISAFGGKQAYMAHLDPMLAKSPLHQSGSFYGSEPGLVAGMEALKMYDPQTVQATCTKGQALAAAMRATLKRLGLNIQLQNEGALLYIHFTPRPIRSISDFASSHAILSEILYRELLLQNILTTPRGMSFIHSIHTQEHLDGYHSAFEKSLIQLLPIIEQNYPDLLIK